MACEELVVVIGRAQGHSQASDLEAGGPLATAAPTELLEALRR
jgi:hypothetical protein